MKNAQFYGNNVLLCCRSSLHSIMGMYGWMQILINCIWSKNISRNSKISILWKSLNYINWNLMYFKNSLTKWYLYIILVVNDFLQRFPSIIPNILESLSTWQASNRYLSAIRCFLLVLVGLVRKPFTDTGRWIYDPCLK